MSAWHSINEKDFRRRQNQRFPMHTCELPPHPDRVYPQLPPNATVWEHLRLFYIKQAVGWSWWRPLRMLRPSTYALEAEQARHAHSRLWWVLHPFSRFAVISQLVQIVCISLSALIAPIYFGFIRFSYFLRPYDGQEYEIEPIIDVNDTRLLKYQNILREVHDNLVIPLAITNVLFVMHILQQFITGYYDEKRMEVVLQPQRIIRRYALRWLFVDVLSCVDWLRSRDEVTLVMFRDILQRNANKNRISLIFYEICVLFWVLRIHYVVEYVYNWCQMAGLRPVSRKAVVYVILLIAFVQWGTFASFHVPLVVRGITLFSRKSTSWLRNPEIAFFDLSQPNLLLRQYLICLHRVLRVISGNIPVVVNGEVPMEDRILLTIFVWFGIAFKIALLVLILQFVDNSHASEVSLTKVMTQVDDYLRHQQVPPEVRLKMQLYYSSMFEHIGIHERFFSERTIMYTLPLTIRQNVWRAGARRILITSPIFRGLPQALVLNIANALREELYLPHDVIYRSGDVARHLYFLSSGTVGVFLATGEEVGHLEDGSYFGEMGLVLSDHRGIRLESVVALEMCQIYWMSRRTFNQLVRPMPRLYNRIRAAAMLRSSEVAPMLDHHDDHDLSSIRLSSFFASQSGTSKYQPQSQPIYKISDSNGDITN